MDKTELIYDMVCKLTKKNEGLGKQVNNIDKSVVSIKVNTSNLDKKVDNIDEKVDDINKNLVSRIEALELLNNEKHETINNRIAHVEAFKAQIISVCIVVAFIVQSAFDFIKNVKIF